MRPLVAWAAADVTTVPIATCFACRAKLHEAKDSQALALAEVSPRSIRYRTADVFGAALVVAGGLFLSAWAGWIGAFGYVASAVVLALAPLVSWYYLRSAKKHEAERQRQWEKSPEKAARDALAARLNHQWADVCQRLASDGWVTDTTVGTERRTSLQPDRLLDPETWRQRDDATYVAWVDSGAVERRLEPARP